jgi:hypothetical protein
MSEAYTTRRYRNDPKFRVKVLDWQKKHRTPELTRKRNLWAHYRITVEDFDAMFESQGRQCAICGSDKPGGRGFWAVDHDHITKQNRSILCHSCNLLLGFCKENVLVLQKAVEYLRRFSCRP